MEELQKSQVQLPDTLEDLSRFVLVNEERIQALRAEIRAIQKVSLAREVYEQKLAEAQEIGQITVEAAQKMGELLLQIQKQSGGVNQYNKEEKSAFTEKSKTKAEVISEIGIERHAANDYQQMAQNPEAVQAAIQKAIERGDVVSRSQVMKEIRAVKEEAERKIRELENRPPEIKEVTKEVVPADYKEAKLKAKSYDAETQRLNKKLQDMYSKRNELEETIKKLQEQTVREQVKGDLLSGVMYFITQCGSFIRDVAGYVWIADKLADIPNKEREGYVRAASAVRDWAVALLQSIERDKEYGEPEIQKLIAESKEQ